MVNLITQLSKYMMAILIVLYSLLCFTAFRGGNKVRQNRALVRQRVILFLVHFLCHVILYLNTERWMVIVLYGVEVVLFVAVLVLYTTVYKTLSKLILNNMLMILSISFVILARLSLSDAKRQVMIAGATLGVCLIVPLFIDKFKYLKSFGAIYALGGMGLLATVFIPGVGVEHYGARNWIQIHGFEFQPSEIVKIVFVLFAAAMLAKRTTFRHVVLTTAVAAGFVLILVGEKDLGGATIFFLTYLMILFVATSNPGYLAAGLGAGGVAGVLAYRLFGHVRRRVIAWRDPWGQIDDAGFQLGQSLLAIGTGGWFGMGLYQGLPTDIPVRESDFIFPVIAEEMGLIFAICLVLISLSCFLMFINIAMKMSRPFYKLAATGFSTLYIFQVFLNVGGATQFIPSTGVTFPLLSYGGSSIISTILIFSVIQGLYVLNQSEEENEKGQHPKETVKERLPESGKKKSGAKQEEYASFYREDD